MSELKLLSIDDHVGVVLPREILERLKVGEGDALYVVETPDGIMLTVLDPEVAEQLRTGRGVMSQYPETLRALAQ